MKKKILFIILLSFIMSILCSCNQSSDLDMNFANPEERFIYSYRNYGTLIRYDIIDKKATIACPDPLCEHGKDCPVTNIFTAYVSKDYIMYGKLENGLLGGYTIYCYDLTNGVVSKVLECPRYQDIVFIKDAAYFSASRVEYNEDGSPDGEVWDVYRYTMASQDLAKLNAESLVSEVLVDHYSEDQIVWWDIHEFSGSSYFSTDYDFQNLTPANGDSIIGDYTYHFAYHYGEDGSLKHDITRTEMSTGTIENVVTGGASYRLDNIDNPKGVVYNTYENDDGRTIYYKSLSDLNEKVLCRIPDEYALSGDEVYPNAGTTLYAGGYIGIYVYPKDADHSEYHSGDTMLFVHIDTGDMFVLSP